MKEMSIMKMKLIVAFALTLLLNTAIAQKVTISGKLKPNDTTTKLRLVNSYTGLDISIPVKEDKSFQAAVTIPTKGFYVLSPIAEVYLVPGAKMQVLPTDDDSYQFSGALAVENNIILNLRKDRKILPIGGEFGIYFSTLNSKPSFFIDKLNAYEKQVVNRISASPDEFFAKTYAANAKNEAQGLLRVFRTYYGLDSAFLQKMLKPKKTNYYKTPADAMRLLAMQAYAAKANYLTAADNLLIDSLSKVTDFNNESLYVNSASYRDNLQNSLVDIVNANKSPQKKSPPDQEAIAILAVVDKLITNQTINHNVKGLNGLAYLNVGKDAKLTDSVYKLMATLKLSSKLRKEIADMERAYKLLKLDPTSLDFAYKTVDEEVVTLKSLRGKYVYIDLWATWCVPCKAEIPSLRKLEEKYKGKNIHFVGISLDKAADKKVWEKYVREENLPGIQIMADKDFRSSFVQAFQVASIPRFLLIAPDGKIISPNADRPSNPALQTQLDNLLK